VGVLVGLGFGLGCLLIWASFSWPRQARVRRSADGRMRRLLDEAGLHAVAPRSLGLLCIATGVVGAIVVLGLTRTMPIAVVLGALAASGHTSANSRRRRSARPETTATGP
jgi:tight adherence protein B